MSNGGLASPVELVETIEATRRATSRLNSSTASLRYTYAAGDIVTVTDGELAGCARVVSVDADGITVEVLATTPTDSVDELMELLADEWSDLLDEE